MAGGGRVSREWSVALVLLTLVALVKVALAASWGLLADEAYYWVWSKELQVSYYDRPGATAWLIALTTLLGESELALGQALLRADWRLPSPKVGQRAGRCLRSYGGAACLPLRGLPISQHPTRSCCALGASRSR